MQVSVESISNLERRIKVAVPEEQISDAVQKKLQEMTRTVKIKGFRPGKVPMKVVAQRYGNQVRSEVIGDIVQRTYYEAVNQEKLRPAGMPNIDTTEAEVGKGLEYTATFEVYPEIEIRDLAYAGKRKLEALGVVAPKREAQILKAREFRIFSYTKVRPAVFAGHTEINSFE